MWRGIDYDLALGGLNNWTRQGKKVVPLIITRCPEKVV